MVLRLALKPRIMAQRDHTKRVNDPRGLALSEKREARESHKYITVPAGNKLFEVV